MNHQRSGFSTSHSEALKTDTFEPNHGNIGPPTSFKFWKMHYQSSSSSQNSSAFWKGIWCPWPIGMATMAPAAPGRFLRRASPWIPSARSWAKACWKSCGSSAGAQLPAIWQFEDYLLDNFQLIYGNYIYNVILWITVIYIIYHILKLDGFITRELFLNEINRIPFWAPRQGQAFWVPAEAPSHHQPPAVRLKLSQSLRKCYGEIEAGLDHWWCK